MKMYIMKVMYCNSSFRDHYTALFRLSHSALCSVLVRIYVKGAPPLIDTVNPVNLIPEAVTS